MDPYQSPRIRLVLDQSGPNPDVNATLVAWKPEDELHGHLEVSSSEDIDIDGVTVYFEGVYRNWIAETGVLSTTILKGERKFLSQAHDILQADITRISSPPATYISTVPFHFVISRMIPCTNQDPPEQCLQLPPSLDLGEALVDNATGKRFAQPSITYFLRAAARITIGASQGSTLETILPVIITPYTEELPPTDITDFPSEFKERETRVLRRTLVGSSLGTMKVSLQEPPALEYEPTSTYSRTEAMIKLEFEAARSSSSGETQKIVQGLSFTIYSLVRAKTFYSIKSFPRLPSQTLLGLSSGTRLREGMIKLETQRVRNVSWGYRFNLERHRSVSPPLPAYLSRSPENVPEKGITGTLDTSEPNGKWVSNWTIPIEVDGRLLPTFCSSWVARLYSLVVRVKVAGAREESFDLEVPLQVVHTSIDKAESTSIEPVSEQFLQYRRDSETSWFSDESLEPVQDPPQYYP